MNKSTSKISISKNFTAAAMLMVAGISATNASVGGLVIPEGFLNHLEHGTHADAVSTFKEVLKNTKFKSDLMKAFSEANIRKEDIDMDVSVDATGRIEGLSFKSKYGDTTVTEDMANAAKDVLEKYGVNVSDFSGKLDPNLDPYAWNVIYKDGGWIFNSKIGNDDGNYLGVHNFEMNSPEFRGILADGPHAQGFSR